MPTALFLLKRREDYSQDPSYSGSYQIATGMWNSAKFVVDVLNDNQVDAGIGILEDANSIDAAVVAANPKVVFVEGLWVTPAKFAELMALPRHSGRTWVVRIHSEIPFLATEGVAMEWIGDYLKQGVCVAPNAPRAHDQLAAFADLIGVDRHALPFLPNCFPVDFRPFPSAELDTTHKDTLDIACFGAYRPMKNHLQQAMMAMRFAKKHGKKLRFHVNNRKDQGGQPVFKNVAAMFAHLPAEFELVVHDWEDRATFLKSMEGIDLLMQESLSETFNIVAADATWVGRPVLANKEIPWLFQMGSDPTDQAKTLQVLEALWANKSFYITQNRARLKAYAKRSETIWVKYVKSFS